MRALTGGIAMGLDRLTPGLEGRQPNPDMRKGRALLAAPVFLLGCALHPRLALRLALRRPVDDGRRAGDLQAPDRIARLPVDLGGGDGHRGRTSRAGLGAGHDPHRARQWLCSVATPRRLGPYFSASLILSITFSAFCFTFPVTWSI